MPNEYTVRKCIELLMGVATLVHGARCIKMVSYNESSNQNRARTFQALIKQQYHRRVRYKMELIYIQSNIKGEGSLELALEMKK